MIARLLVSFGLVAAAVGLSTWGIATSTYQNNDDWLTIGYGLMIGGVVASVVGWLLYRNGDGAHY